MVSTTSPKLEFCHADGSHVRMDPARQPPEQSDSGIEAQNTFDAFISYSRNDVEFAQALGKALQRFRPPKGLGVPRRRMRVFRDETDLVGTHYPDAIAGFLKRSRKLILICSPAARDSKYVDDEIVRFAKSRASRDIVPVLYRGRPNGEYEPGQTDDRAFPAAIGELMQEPLATDYRGFESGEDKVDQSNFRNAWYTLLANLYDVGRNDIERRDFRRQRRERAAIVTVVSLVLASLATFGAIAWVQKLKADEQRNLALTGLAVNLAAKSHALLDTRPHVSALVAVEAATVTDAAARAPVVEAKQALRDSLSALSGRRLPDTPDDLRAIGFDGGAESVYAVGTNEVRRWPIGQEQSIADSVIPWSLNGDGGGSAKTAVSANGRWFASINGNVTRVIDLRAQQLETVEAVGLENDIAAMVISDEGRWLAAHTDCESLLLLDLASGGGWQTVVDEPDPSAATALVIKQFGFGPGDSMLHAAISDEKLRFWSLGEVISYQEPSIDFDPPLDKLTVTQDGHLLALARYKERLAVYRFGDGGAGEVTLPGKEISARGVSFSPDDRWLVAESESGDTMLWDTGDLTADPLLLDIGLPKPLSSSSFSPDGRRLAATSRDGTIRMWDMERPGRRPGEFEPASDDVKGLQFSPDARLLTWIDHYGTVGVIDVESDEETAALTLRYPSRVRDISISANSRWMLTSMFDTLWLTNLEDPFGGIRIVHDVRREPGLERKRSTRGPGFDALSSMSGTPIAGLPSAGAFSSNGRWFATIGEQGDVLLVNRTRRHSAPRHMNGLENAMAVTFDPTGVWLAAGGQGEDVLAWNTQQPHAQPLRLRRVDSGGESTVARLLFSPDGRWLAAGAAFGEAELWDWSAISDSSPASGDEPSVDAEAISLAGHDGWVLSIDFALDGSLLVTAGERAAQVWAFEDLAGPAARFEIPLGYSQARLIPNQRTVVTGGSDGVARIWDIDDPDAQAIELRGHEASIINLALEAQGNRLATVSEDGDVMLWQLDGEQSGSARELAHRGANAVTFVSSQELVSAGYGPTRLWNLADLSEPAIVLQGGEAPSYWTGLSADADAVATVVFDGTARLWPLGTERLIDIVCEITEANLEHSIWRDAFGDKPYEKTCERSPVHRSVVKAGRELAEKGDVDKAIELLTRAVGLDPEIGIDPQREVRGIAVEAMLERGKKLARNRKIIAATVQFERAKALQEDAVSDPFIFANKLAAGQVHLQQAKEMASKGRFEAAVANYITARGVDPEIHVDPVAEALKLAVPVYLRRARDAARRGNIERAIEIYRDVLEMDSSQTFDPAAEASRHAARGHQSSAASLARDGQIERAIEQFQLAMQLDPTLNIDPLLEARRLGAPMMARAAVRELMAGRVDEGLAQLRDAMQAKPDMEITAECWNQLCWHGVLWNRTAAVKSACEKAVTLEPGNGSFRDSRGLMRALQGNQSGAIADFEAYIATAASSARYEERIEQRRRWVAHLKNGDNPITAAELSRLREAGKNFWWFGTCAN